MKTLSEILQEFLEITGQTQAQVANAMGVKQQAVQQVVSGKTAQPRYLPELLVYMDRALPTLAVFDTYPDLRELKKVLGENTGTGLPFDPRTTEQNLNTFNPPRDLAYSKKDLPVYASAEGGDGEVIISHDPIDWVARPDKLARTSNAYALYVINDSMFPALKPGHILEINPNKPPKPGNYVVVVLRDKDDLLAGERRCMVKEFVRRTPDSIFLHQYNPDRTFDIPTTDVESMQLVSGVQVD